MREDYAAFTARAAEIIAVAPERPDSVTAYWMKEQLPFPGLADLKHGVADTYDQEVTLYKMGRMPALFVVDKTGMVRYQKYGESMSDIPPNQIVLEVLDEVNKS